MGELLLRSVRQQPAAQFALNLQCCGLGLVAAPGRGRQGAMAPQPLKVRMTLATSLHNYLHTLHTADWPDQGGLVGVLQKQPSVIMLTFTVGPGPYADFYSGARPPC